MTPRNCLVPGRRARQGLILVITVIGLVTSACGVGVVSGRQHTTALAAATSGAGASPSVTSPSQAAVSGIRQSKHPKPLAGKIIGIDPGHNGHNHLDPAFIDHQIWNGREWEDCDTTGTETDSGYTEARYNWNVAMYLTRDLRRDGAKVVLTRHSNVGVGPCVNRRSEIINHAHANVAIDIHADGGPPTGRGFAILEPVADGPNDHVIKSSERFGYYVRSAFLKYTPMPTSTYDGVHGIKFRDDLAGLNLTRVPKVLVECGNMRNATDARLLTSSRFQQEVARALTAAIIHFLRKR
jgi:N-acetylmuramoyl-L-alanine amidase